jgi:hypothetical protein
MREGRNRAAAAAVINGMTHTRHSVVATTLLIVILGLLGAGCGSGARPASTHPRAHRTIHVSSGRHTFKPGVLAFGDKVICGLAGAGVPKPGLGVGGFADGTTNSSDIQLTVSADGAVAVSCQTG